MLRRIATGVALALAALALTLWTPAWLFAALAGAVMLAALWEWRRLVVGFDADGESGNAALSIAAAALAAAAVWLFFAPQKLQWFCLAGLLFWGWQGLQLAAGGVSISSGPTAGALRALVQGGFVLLFAWAGLLLMRLEAGAAATLGMLAVVWSADTCAYFTGKAIGKRKLAPAISPGKTIEGVIGGVAGALLVAWAAAWLLELSPAQTAFWLAAAGVAVAFSVAGDLYESCLKRRAGVKDSGAFLPGHGGVLDRVDGLLAATPAFATVWRLSA